jgi:hypothetical protein
VAIKFLFCIELTPGRIVEFCKEAALLHSLQHANIINCFGVAIMPPAISLVSEYCTYGSLFDFLHSTDLIMKDDDKVEERPQREGRARSKSAPRRVRTETGETVESTASERRVIVRPSSKLFKDITSSNANLKVIRSDDQLSSKDVEQGLEQSAEDIRDTPHNPMHSAVSGPDHRRSPSVDMLAGHLEKSRDQRIELLRYLDPQNNGKVDAGDVASKLAEAMTSSNGPVSLTTSQHVSSDRSSFHSKRLTAGSSMVSNGLAVFRSSVFDVPSPHISSSD